MAKKPPLNPRKPFWKGVTDQEKKRKKKQTNNSLARRGTQKFSPKVYSEHGPSKRNEKSFESEEKPLEHVRLNRFIAQAGICSRREADELIKAGKIKVNGKIVRELGIRVSTRTDKVFYDGKLLSSAKYEYILLNKPKNTITTTNDPKGRKTVMDVIQNASKERIFPVGRLDRNTTGLLLLTNDGVIAKKMTHPSYRVKKIYHVRLDKEVEETDLQELVNGIELDDGRAKVDKIDYVSGKEKNEIGLEIHIGKNRIVRRLFEHLGYKVIALDRVMLAHLTKKNLPRGKWRHLTPKEINFLKML